MRLALAALLFAVPRQDPPLKPLTEVAKPLSEAMTDFVKGKEASEAFKSWGASVEDVEKLRAQLKEAGAASAVFLGVEFELFYVKDKRIVYSVRTVVCADAKEAGFLEVRAGAVKETTKKPFPFDRYKDSYTGFGAAAKALVKHLSDEKSGDLTFADARKLAKLGEGLLDNDEAKLAKELDKARQNLAAERAAIAALKYDSVELHLEDAIFVVRDSNGKAVGTIEGRFQSPEDGKLELQIRKFRGPKK